MEKLQAGIIGIGGYGAKYLEGLNQNEHFSLRAIADQNMERAKNFALRYGAEAYDDYRRVIVQEKLDALFLTLPTFLCGDCIHLAAKKGIRIFKETPLARTLPEAMRSVELVEKTGGTLSIAAQRRFAPGYLYAHRLVKENKIGKVFLVKGECFYNFEEDWENLSWRGDPVLAGGGILQESAYHLIDQIVWTLGIPEKIYCLTSAFCSKRNLPPSRTEDTATMSLSFADGAMGTILCSWSNGPREEHLCYYGIEGTIEAGSNIFRHFDREGRLLEEQYFHVDESWLVSQQIRHFGNSLIDPEVKPISPAREHLPNIAIIEAAYLSARTGLPEQLKLYGTLFEL